jgi:hypothetical protein
MCVYCVRELGLDPEKVNVNGGAIAFGHPLDASYFCSIPKLVIDVILRSLTGDRRTTDCDWSE